MKKNGSTTQGQNDAKAKGNIALKVGIMTVSRLMLI